MKVFTEPLHKLAQFDEAKNNLIKGRHVSITGCADAQKTQMVFAQADHFSYKVILTYSEQKARQICEDYSFFDGNTIFFPSKDYIFYQADIHGRELQRERLKVFQKILQQEPITIVTTADTLMAPYISLDELKKNCISLSQGSILEEQAAAIKLVQMGYEKTYQVEAPGQFSIRGGILDIFDMTQENPVRIELWGDEIDSIRVFDVLSQRSIEGLKEVTIYPATEMLLSAAQKQNGMALIKKESLKAEKKFRDERKIEEADRIRRQYETLKNDVEDFGELANLDSYMGYFYESLYSFLDLFPKEEMLVVFDEPLRSREHLGAVEAEFRESMTTRMEKGYALAGQAAVLYSTERVIGKIKEGNLLAISMLENKEAYLDIDDYYSMNARNIGSFQKSMDLLVKELKEYRKNNYSVILLSPSRTRAKRLAQDLDEYGVNAFYCDNYDHIPQPKEVMVMYGQLSRGFEYYSIGYAVITEGDIFGKKSKEKKRKKVYDGKKIQDFAELTVGDYVVHEQYGLGIYRGIEKLVVDKVVRDYMKIEYKDGENLYVLTSAFDCVMKYAASDAAKVPKINKLGSPEWNKTKAKVKSAVSLVAQDLVNLYAARQQQKGYEFLPDTVWQQEFEEMFPYEETDDQLAAIEATKKDMESDKIMDRLICGDVGFGKTEVAIRAAFKAAQDGKQVVFLVPTTILAKQHYDNFVQRMKDYPVNIEMLSRFKTPQQQKKIQEGLKNGTVDIVIGTHKVLNKSIEYKDLGLLIIDEEQRFGVTHKEKLKKLKENVDVLTLTATPIPRTLHMSLVGIRDMSVLEQAPNDRMPIQTYVMEYNEEMVREAIERELARQGQVYFVYNKVASIAQMAASIQQLVPDANVAFAHGQMKESELERIMFDFISGEIDVLVATTIIETGLDIPNVNTIIIQNSDKMGLSQLYQLRGRVGRSNRTAYAFLMYNRDKLLTEVAEKRLQAIREFTELGSGIKIAMKDLEIRGAGAILGNTQHGHMEAVGYDLYCKMLSEAVKKLKGEKRQQEDFVTTIDLDVDAYIPDSFILNEYQKLNIYKRIAAIEDAAAGEDLRNELADRFGEIPKSVENLIRISLIRIHGHELFLSEIKGNKNGIIFTMNRDAQIKAENIEMLLANMNGKMVFSPANSPTFTYKLHPFMIVNKDEEMILSETERIIKMMKARLLY